MCFIDPRTRVDTRCNDQIGESVLIHKKGSKVVGLHCNPVQPDLLLSAGNDHFVSFFHCSFDKIFLITVLLPIYS